MNENQIQYSHTMILHYTILHLTVLAVQHPFQLYLSRSLFCFFFCINDDLARTSSGNKNKVLPPFIKVKVLLFSIQYGQANFLYVLIQKPSHIQKNHLQSTSNSSIKIFVFLRHHMSKSSMTIVLTHQSTVKDRHLYSYLDCEDQVLLQIKT